MKPAETVSGLQPYPAYKPSGVEWLGEVPAHWEVRRLKTVCSMQSGDGITATSIEPRGDYPVYGGHGQRGYTSSYTHDGTFVLIGRQGALCGNVHIASGRFWASEHALVTTPNVGHSPEWLGAILEAMNLGQYSIAAAQPGLSLERVLELRMPVPDTSEQASIARYLEDADQSIRRCIQAKEKLVKLLEEQRQALINEAVTGRVDVRTGQPYPAYKPSGVEWLGEVPRHWVVASLRHRYQQCLGKMLDAKHISGEHLFPYLRNTDVQWDEINVVDLPTMDIRPVEVGRYTVRRGDLLVCEGGEVGRCAIWDGDSEVVGYQKALHRLRPHRNDRDIPRFMYYTLRSATERAAFDDGHESTIGHLTGDKLRAHRFPFPPFSEQSAIAYYLDHTDQRVRRNIQAAKRQIHLLEEYRTRLIADVVTGMLDVRETAIRLPNGVKETGAPAESDAPAKIDPDSARCLGYAPWDSDV